MQTTYTIDNIPKIPHARIAILQAKWYSEITDSLVEKCTEVLQKADCEVIEHHILPGSLELPLAAKALIESAEVPYDAIVCVGGIIKGETLHFEMIVNECMRGLGQVMMEKNIPIIVEVLPVLKLEHLQARCADNESNK
jgi:6,7-dimethyl-8-ribityllumazine synthase